ncbi:uncharacterized protein BDZ99DRAFT_498365 [Mytilinidion resinicola]|uniref:Uncharacterized protein n=1 Tax=Mytilinidion resinicola TaxID=574789 RepID=A0A6A6YQB6_9PEZI|nr:uncharacterized protein BDZ99DRAFT_498365 [Mytilinidion resinicola]KAF2810185.1 hypothetical protein BDZ99DRAFT_498365 [Mytilinidion resinicola]
MYTNHLVFTALAALFSISTADPTCAAGQAGPPQKSQAPGPPGGVYMCTGSNWSGQCQYVQSIPGQCHPLEPPFYRSTSSIGPNPTTHCWFWDNDKCTAGDAANPNPYINLVYPGNPDLLGQGWKDRAQSFICDIY